MVEPTDIPSTARPILQSQGQARERQQCEGCGRRNMRGDIECQGCGYVTSSMREFSQHSVGAWEGRRGQEGDVDAVHSRFQGMNIAEQLAMNPHGPETRGAAIPAQEVREEGWQPTTGFQPLGSSSNTLKRQQLLPQQLFSQQLPHQTLLPQQFLYSQPILHHQAPHLQPILPQQAPHLQPILPQQAPHLQLTPFPLQPQVFSGHLPGLRHQPGPSSRESFIWLLEQELHLQRELEVLAREKVAGGLSRENLILLLERELGLQRELDKVAREKETMEAVLQQKRKEEHEGMAIGAMRQQEQGWLLVRQQEQGRLLVRQQEQHRVMVEEQWRREEDQRRWEDVHRRREEEAHRRKEEEDNRRKEEYRMYRSEHDMKPPSDSVEGGARKELRDGREQEAKRVLLVKGPVREGDEDTCSREGELQGAAGEEKDLVKQSAIVGRDQGSDESIINVTSSTTRFGNNTMDFFYSENEVSGYENNDELVDDETPTAGKIEAPAEGAAVKDTSDEDNVVLQQEKILEQIRRENEAERQSRELVSRLAQESGPSPRRSEFPARDLRTVKGPSTISSSSSRDKIAALKAAAEAQGSCVLGTREGCRGRDRVEELMREQERQVERLRREAEERERESRRQTAEKSKKIQVTAALTAPREEGSHNSAGGINFMEVFAMAERKRTAEKSKKKLEEKEEKMVRARRKSEAMAELDSERRLAGEVIRQRQAAQVGNFLFCHCCTVLFGQDCGYLSLLSMEHFILQDREVRAQESLQAREAVSVEREEAARRKKRTEGMAKLAALAAGDSRHSR